MHIHGSSSSIPLCVWANFHLISTTTFEKVALESYPVKSNYFETEKKRNNYSVVTGIFPFRNSSPIYLIVVLVPILCTKLTI